MIKSFKTKLQSAQNRLIRVILGMDPRTHIGRDQFKVLNWLPVDHRVTLARLTMVHKIKYGEVPTVLRTCFRHVNEVHSHFTRASIADMVLPGFRTKVGKGSFIYIGATQWNSQWNSLEISMKLTSNLRTFKQKTKRWLLEKVPI